MTTQAEKIVRRFGGAYQLARALAAAGAPRHVSQVYRWMWPRSRGGTDGWIPAKAMPDVLRAARREGILLGPDDMHPDPERKE